MPDLLVGFDEFESLAADILQNEMRLRFKARGGSMRPFIRDGDLVEIQRVASGALQRGDVVLCRLENGRLVVHRVIRTGPQDVLIQGDAFSRPDGRVAYSDVLGQVVVIWRQGKALRLNGFWMKIFVSAWLLLAPLRGIAIRAIAWWRKNE